MANLRRVYAGERFKPSAGDWNEFIEAAKARGRLREGAAGQRTPASIAVLVKNGSGSDQAIGTVLGITGVVIAPVANLPGFQQCPAVVGNTPSFADHAGRFIVLTTPVPAGGFGQGVIAGLAAAQVNMSDESHRRAVINDGQTTLKSVYLGGVPILWVEAGTGIKWALVMVGGFQVPEPADPTVDCVLAWDGTNHGAVWVPTTNEVNCP